MKLQFSIPAFALVVVFVAEIVLLYKSFFGRSALTIHEPLQAPFCV